MSSWAKYSGLAFQMGVVIFAGALLAKHIEKKWAGNKPFISVIIILISIFGAIYLAIKDFIKKD